MATQKPHAIVICYPLQGHFTPAINLAISLASHGFTITFINTQSIHHQLGGGDVFSGARLAGLDIRYTTVSDGLPLGFDRSLNHDQFMTALLHVFSAHAEEAVREIVESARPAVSCLVADTFFVWPGKLAKRYGLLYVSFWTEPALIFSLYYHMDLLLLNGHVGCIENRKDEIDYIPGVQSIHPKDLTSYLQHEHPVVNKIINQAFMDVKSADFVLCNTVQELEPQTISALQQKIPFFAIGPIFPKEVPGMSPASTSLWSETDCSHWLDSKPPGSVLYVSFGSYAHLAKTDLMELAHGIMQSKVDFLWAMRPDIVSSDDQTPLPDKFREGVGEHGMIVAWCNQPRVLAHPAVGGFLTHCGWNSVLESIWCGVPLLCFPLCTDQLTNRKLIVDDWHIGINLCDKTGGDRVSEAEVADKIRRLMVGEDGDQARAAVNSVNGVLHRAVAPNGSSDTNMTSFVRQLERKVSQPSGILG